VRELVVAELVGVVALVVLGDEVVVGDEVGEKLLELGTVADLYFVGLEPVIELGLVVGAVAEGGGGGDGGSGGEDGSEAVLPYKEEIYKNVDETCE
jgi:hypothetical protein